MAIKSSRSESIQDSKASGARTGLIEWMNNGTISLESHRNVGLGNASSCIAPVRQNKGAEHLSEPSCIADV